MTELSLLLQTVGGGGNLSQKLEKLTARKRDICKRHVRSK